MEYSVSYPLMLQQSLQKLYAKDNKDKKVFGNHTNNVFIGKIVNNASHDDFLKPISCTLQNLERNATFSFFLLSIRDKTSVVPTRLTAYISRSSVVKGSVVCSLKYVFH